MKYLSALLLIAAFLYPTGNPFEFLVDAFRIPWLYYNVGAIGADVYSDFYTAYTGIYSVTAVIWALQYASAKGLLLLKRV
jgi:hypothetical protein